MGWWLWHRPLLNTLFVVINFGLDISAVKDVSVHRNDKLALNRIVSTVLFIKLILFLLCSFVLLVGMLVVPFMEQNKILMLFAFLTCFVRAVVSRVYYQGSKR